MTPPTKTIRELVDAEPQPLTGQLVVAQGRSLDVTPLLNDPIFWLMLIISLLPIAAVVDTAWTQLRGHHFDPEAYLAGVGAIPVVGYSIAHLNLRGKAVTAKGQAATPLPEATNVTVER